MIATGIAVALVSAGVALNRPGSGHRQAGERVDFNRDIRPILNENCTSCHGGVKQAGEVSFIYREEALGKGKSGRPIVIPGKPNASELISRVTSHDPERRMPLNAPPLSGGDIALLKQWIREGAHWEDYWAFVAPKPQTPPQVRDVKWVRQPLDRFILARLEKEGLAPSPEADRAALLRRVSFDLTGLPPTPEALETFLADTSQNAYEKQVDRLLASPAYGERWASMWLDLARYADSLGYESDQDRPGAWPYRNWVIGAFNRNLPYDQFIIKQLAGDLLSEATFEDLIASSFHRQTPTSSNEDDEEYRLVAVMDRVATTWNVLNGVTMNCVQCHSHPYDPLRHTDYYKSLAFFNTSRDADIDFNFEGHDQNLKTDWPVLSVPRDTALFPVVADIQRKIKALRTEIVIAGRDRVAGDDQWRSLTIDSAKLNEAIGQQMQLADSQARLAKLPPNTDAQTRKHFLDLIEQAKKRLAEAKTSKKPPATFRLYDGMAEPTGTVPLYSVFELTAPVETPVMTALRIEAPPADVGKARHSPEKGFIVDSIEAWMIAPDGATKEISFRYLAPDSEADLERNMMRMISNPPAPAVGSPMAPIRHLAANSGFMANPKHFRARWLTAIPAEPLHVPAGGRIRIRITHTDGIRSIPAYIPRVHLMTSSNPGWTQFASSPALEGKIAQLEQLERRIREIETVPLPIMEEQAAYERRETLKFERGNFLEQTGPAISPDVPGLFPSLSGPAPRNRLTLARWFFSPNQPLTARVAVNRYWEQLFGLGLVETLEDFGSAGEEPSHPELLDWLALHFQNDLHWDMKALLRELVTSATYRQQGKTTPLLLEKDPRNRLLARGPQQRLTAEMVRDQALAASGLLNSEMGGPPVMPPQPEGVWRVGEWRNSTGPDRYRRAVYTYIKRTSGYPSFLTFDASEHLVSLARRIPTNTPLQALVTMNDPVYREAAAALARRMREKVAANNENDVLDHGLNYGARCVLSRDLTAYELRMLRELHDDFLNEYKDEKSDALTAAAIALLNLDASLTR